MMPQLVLSLFPGIGMLDKAFEDEGFCVVRGPDVLWGGDIRNFHPPAGKFDGVIGGPPCQCFSRLKYLNPLAGKNTVNLIPEFCRCIAESQPSWWLMENVREADHPEVRGYVVACRDLCDNNVGGRTLRRRRFWFGTRGGLNLDIIEEPGMLIPDRAVTRNARVPQTRHVAARKRKGGLLPGDGIMMTTAKVCELQGLSADFPKNGPLKTSALRLMLGNGVPLAMGRAIAKAVKTTLQGECHCP